MLALALALPLAFIELFVIDIFLLDVRVLLVLDVRVLLVLVFDELVVVFEELDVLLVLVELDVFDDVVVVVARKIIPADVHRAGMSSAARRNKQSVKQGRK